MALAAQAAPPRHVKTSNVKVAVRVKHLASTHPFAAAAAVMHDPATMSDRVTEAYRRALDAADDGIFVAMVPQDAVAAAVGVITDRSRNGETLPLAGTIFTAKDNIDVAGLPTSSNIRGYGRIPQESAPAVLAAERAGAILIGKTTMDQCATGLSGTRTKGTICRNAIDPAYIPGGSSSGSAVAVARGLCDFSLGSDTGGSGRVPAAANGIVGLKPSLGLVSSRGMVYCNRSFDCIPVFAKTVGQAFAVLEAIAGHDQADPYSREDAGSIPLGAPQTISGRLAVLGAADLNFFGDAAAAAAYRRNAGRLIDLGYRLEEIDFAPFREAGEMVFKSALVAERLLDYGDFIEASPDAVVEPVRTAINAGRDYSARDLFKVLHRLQALQRAAREAIGGCDALVVPTIPRLYTIAEMCADPMEKNNVMGTYTYFVNPLDLCAISVPGYVRPDGLPSALSFVGNAGRDGVLRRYATAFELA
jgi:allophanate hydrolase